MKKIKYITATIIIGAMGSAFWEVGLKKFFNLIVNELMPHLMQCFNDSFYSRVSRSLNATSLNSFAYIMLLFMMMIMLPRDFLNQVFHTPQERHQDKLLQGILQYACFFAIAYHFLIVAMASNIARDTINNIEIVAPYITDIEYKQLRSSFFQIDSRSDYQLLTEELETLAETNNLQLK